MEINCKYCNKQFYKKPSEITNNNFCSNSCFYEYKKSLLSDDYRYIIKFIKSAWTNLNIRAINGKYHQDTNKNKCYKTIYIEFNRKEFKNWCFENQKIILSLKRPSLDRIDANLNYSIDNIQIIELNDNIKKKRPGNNYKNGPKSNIIRGIRKTKSGKKYIARITVNRKETYLGTFNTEAEALLRFKTEYRKIYGIDPF